MSFDEEHLDPHGECAARRPSLESEEIVVTPEMIAAGMDVADHHDSPGTFQPVTIHERALEAVYIAMRRLEASCAKARK